MGLALVKHDTWMERRAEHERPEHEQPEQEARQVEHQTSLTCNNGEGELSSAERWAFLTGDERSFIPAIEFVLGEMDDCLPFQRAHEIWAQAHNQPTSEVVFVGFYHHWNSLGATHDMILAAIVILAGRGKPYNMLRATSKVIQDFMSRT